ncbi:TetR family transcriptional regulator [Nocardioides sp. YIM 152588]|uniref:TetR family transcriptional regulator n=1 Tax=Nocardioides sp. YIM 152588 TaxID=3158259 RepID=UPI0032E50819
MSAEATPSPVTGVESGLPTERRILLAAEQLFAERGIDAVSLRSVMAAAGTNVASVHYHFGSKDALVAALIRERAGEVSARRAVLLDGLAEPGALDAPSLARAFVEPVAHMALHDGPHWVRMVSGIMATGHPSISVLIDGFRAQALTFTDLLSRLHPEWTLERVRFRLSHAMRTTFTVLGDLGAGHDLQQISTSAMTTDQIVAELNDLVAAILSDPVVGAPEPRD